MKIDIKRTDKLYEEFITYMAYRYAIGLAGASSEYTQKRLSAYEIFREMEYDTPEFYQLADEIAQYLKRKKIKDIVDLQKKCKKAELNWFSYHYALGRHSYAAAPHRCCCINEEYIVEDNVSIKALWLKTWINHAYHHRHRPCHRSVGNMLPVLPRGDNRRSEREQNKLACYAEPQGGKGRQALD